MPLANPKISANLILSSFIPLLQTLQRKPLVHNMHLFKASDTLLYPELCREKFQNSISKSRSAAKRVNSIYARLFEFGSE